MLRNLAICISIAGLLASCGLRRHPYDNPITKDTKQPDKVLYDKAINDIEHGRFEIARITLNTLINTYDQSEFMAKAKLAIADSWFREGGAHGLAQAEAEYKDFILFYPTMEESAESQMKICRIHYNQMEKPDRDASQAIRANDECTTMLTQFPNSKHVPEVQQMLRNVQEALAEGEFRVGHFYFEKQANPAAANRLQHLVNQYPLYSKSDEALWELGHTYAAMGNRFRPRAGEAYARIVREYPLSSYVDEAKKELNRMEFPIPQPDPAALARMQYDLEHQDKPGMLSRTTGFVRRGPDVHMAAKTGAPVMTTLRPSVPVSVPTPADSNGAFSGDVTATALDSTDSTALDTKPDARMNPPAAAQATQPPPSTTPNATAPNATAPAATAAKQNEPLPSNYDALNKKMQNKLKKQKEREQKKQKKQEKQNAAQPAAASAGSQ